MVVVYTKYLLPSLFSEQMAQSVCGNCEIPFSKVTKRYSPLPTIEAVHLDVIQYNNGETLFSASPK